MLRADALEALTTAGGGPPFIAVGTFDGVHRGHQAVIEAMLRAARAEGALAAVLTFVPHPLAVLRPEQAPDLLSSPDQRARHLEALGVDALVELRFDAALAEVTAVAFVQEYLCRRAGARRAFVGADFRFGARAAGTAETLAVLGRQASGLQTGIVPLVRAEGGTISSTRIRKALADGRPGLAARLLGHPFALEGCVIPGERRGRTIGFPTANVVPPRGVVCPAPGVYAVRSRVDNGPWLAGVANLGRNPTTGTDQPLQLEVHLLGGFRDDLYGRQLEVAFVRRLRGERPFADMESLKVQIAHDAARAQRLLLPSGSS